MGCDAPWHVVRLRGKGTFVTAPTGQRPRATPTPEVPRGQRLASSIRLPWLVGLASLATVALIGVGLTLHERGERGVARADLEAQQATAVGTAQHVRRSLNEASDDLWEAARSLALGTVDDRVPVGLARQELRALAARHQRYTAVAVVSAATGRAVVGAPGEPALAPVGRLPDDRRLVRFLDDGRLVASVPVRSRGDLLVAGVVDPLLLVPAFAPPPGLVLAGPSATARFEAPTVIDGLTAEALDDAVRRGRTSAGTLATDSGPGRAVVLAYAPVTGTGPAGAAGLSVVVVRELALPTGPAPDFLVSGLAQSAALLALAGLVFWWLHLALIRPLIELQRTAERIAYGDLSKPVVVSRYDEVGEAGRALERLRLDLIRAEVQDLQPRAEHRTGASEEG